MWDTPERRRSLNVLFEPHSLHLQLTPEQERLQRELRSRQIQQEMRQPEDAETRAPAVTPKPPRPQQSTPARATATPPAKPLQVRSVGQQLSRRASPAHARVHAMCLEWGRGVGAYGLSHVG